MNERDLYAKFKKNVPGFYTRIENAISSGAPDVVAVYNGNIFFIELKILRSGKIKFQPSQIVWALDFFKERGLNYYCLVGSGDDVYRLYAMSTILTLKRFNFENFFLISLDNCNPVAIGFKAINTFFGNTNQTEEVNDE